MERLSFPQDCPSPGFSLHDIVVDSLVLGFAIVGLILLLKNKGNNNKKKWTFPSSPTKPRSQKQSRQFVILDCMWQEENTELSFQCEPLWTWKGCRQVIWFSHKVLQPSKERRVSFWCGVCQAPGRKTLLRQCQLAVIPTSIPKAKAMASARLAWERKQKSLGVLTTGSLWNSSHVREGMADEEVGEKNIFPSKKHWKRKGQWSKLLTKCGVLWKTKTLGSSKSQWEISAEKV